MDDDLAALKDDLVESFFCLKRIISSLHVEANNGDEKCWLSMAEVALMKDIQDNTVDSANNANITDIQNHLHISKAGVSKMLGVLEKKGYINRDIDKNNRRNLIITLTQKGHDAVNNLYRESDEQLTKIIRQLGEADTKKFVKYVNKLADAMKTV